MFLPLWDLGAADEVASDGERSGDPGLAKLAEEGDAGGLGEVAGCAVFVVSVGVNDGEPFPGEEVLEGGGAIEL